jgi:hypothetical protein
VKQKWLMSGANSFGIFLQNAEVPVVVVVVVVVVAVVIVAAAATTRTKKYPQHLYSKWR